MEQLEELFKKVAARGTAKGNFLGLLHILIGRRISLLDGTLVSPGMTWRDLATWLKQVRWDRDTVAELGLEGGKLPPRDRERYWYTVIARAGVDSGAAVAAGDRLIKIFKELGYEVGPAPGKLKRPADAERSSG
ncbi:MAG: hypothetical protein ACRD36_08965 [Candidatus Acidiferrum sp.]